MLSSAVAQLFYTPPATPSCRTVPTITPMRRPWILAPSSMQPAAGRVQFPCLPQLDCVHAAARTAYEGLSCCVRVQVLDYGVPENNVLGIRFGFRGFYDRHHKPVVLTRK